MPNYRRANIAGGTYFFTVNAFRHLPVLTEAPVRAALREAIRHTRARHPFEIDARVLLPDHLHCIWTLPEGDAGFSVRRAKIKRYVSKECGAKFGAQALTESRTQRREAGLWQRRFWEHQIHDDLDFYRHVDYIHWNPVKHGLVARAFENICKRGQVLQSHILNYKTCPRLLNGSSDQLAVQVLKRPSF